MKLNLYILKDFLSTPILQSRIRAPRLSRLLEGPALYRGGQTVSADRVWILSVDQWRENSRRIGAGAYIVCTEDADGAVSIPEGDGGPDHLLVRAADTAEVLEAVQQVFLRFGKWENALYRLLVNNEPLRRYGNASLWIFGNPIALYSSGFQCLFYSERQKEPQYMLFSRSELNQFLPLEDIEGLRLNMEFANSILAEEPSIFSDEFWGYRILFCNIRVGGQFVARVMTCETERPIRDSDHALLEYFAGFMKQAYLQLKKVPGRRPAGLDDLLLSMLHGARPDPEELDGLLAEIGWKRTDACFLTIIPGEDYDQAMGALATFAIRLESSIPFSLTLVDDRRIYLLVDLKRNGNTRTETISFLKNLLTENVLKAGFSRVFDRLDLLCDFSMQADRAIRLGERIHPMQWFYDYGDYALRDLLEGAAGGYPTEALCPEGLLALLQYDREHGRQYTRTLKTLLDADMSITKVTSALFLQRSTVNYQLRRIGEITHLRFSDPSETFLYRLVFHIMEIRAYELP